MVNENTAIEETQQEGAEDTSAVAQTTPQPEPQGAPKPEAIPAPEPDWKAEAEKHRLASEGFRQQADREAQLRKTAEGRLAKEAETNRRLLRVEEYTRRSVPEEERAEADKQAEAVALSEAQRRTGEEEVGAIMGEINDYAQDMGKSFETDPIFAPLRDGINKEGRYGTALREIRKLFKADQTAKVQATQAAEQARRVATQPRQERTNIASPRPAAAAVTVTSDNIDALWVAFDNEHPNETNPYAAQYRAMLSRL